VGIKNIIVLDDSFRKYAGNEKVLWERGFNDQHFSELAHSLTADILANYIHDKGFVSQE
jgi:hypothetical protein